MWCRVELVVAAYDSNHSFCSFFCAAISRLNSRSLRPLYSLLLYSNSNLLNRFFVHWLNREWLVYGTLASHLCNTRSKEQGTMASKDLDTRVVDQSGEIEKSESELKEKVQRLKQ